MKSNLMNRYTHILLSSIIPETYAGLAVSDETHPNVVIILADDQRYDALGCMGHPFAETPNIDRLAKEGVLFEQATVSTPLCGPNRASLLTGCYAHHHLLKNNGTEVPEKVAIPVPCFPALLRDAGYETALFGKVHDGNAYYPDPGFNTFEHCLEGGKYWNVKFKIDGKPQVMPGHVDEVITERAVNWIQQQIHNKKPFMVELAHIAPHMPITGSIPEQYRNLYKGVEKIPRRPDVYQTDFSQVSGWNRQGVDWFKSMRDSGKIPAWTWPPPWSDEQIRDRMRLSKVLDESVRQVYDTLKKGGVLDNTIFIYHSDNGYYLGEHGLSEKYYPFEEGLRVPMIVRYPKEITAGTRNEALVQTIDIAPTILQWCGLPPSDSFDGKSLQSALLDPTGFREVTSHEFFLHKGVTPPAVWAAIRNPTHKYARFYKPTRDEEFYDLTKDPYELDNRINDPVCVEDAKRYRHIFEQAEDGFRTDTAEINKAR
jgi:N-acetylglucosamine-6-sulfatase